MGGFMEYEGNQPIRVLFPETLQSYSLTGNGDFPRISKAEIEDRSKGDAISKSVAILQTGWFVTQCIARALQGLPITELELVTVAFATLNFVIYLLWWDKPLNVQRGVRVYKKRTTEEPVDDGDAEATVGFWAALGDALSDLPAAIEGGPLIEEDIPWLARVLSWPLIKPLYTIVGSVDVHFLKMRVGTLYPTEWTLAAGNFSIFVVLTITVAFGGIHCIGWSFAFPSSIERTLWRISSASITGVPILLLPLCLLGDTVDTVIFQQQLFDSFNSGMTTVLVLSVYILSRLALLILPFLCLRSLPPAAFYVVHWTSLIPHV